MSRRSREAKRRRRFWATYMRDFGHLQIREVGHSSVVEWHEPNKPAPVKPSKRARTRAALALVQAHPHLTHITGPIAWKVYL